MALIWPKRMKSDYLNAAGYTSYTLYQHAEEGCNSIFSSPRLWWTRPCRTIGKTTIYGIVTWHAHGGPTGAGIGYGSCGAAGSHRRLETPAC